MTQQSSQYGRISAANDYDGSFLNSARDENYVDGNIHTYNAHAQTNYDDPAILLASTN
jgi:hypothetical protein